MMAERSWRAAGLVALLVLSSCAHKAVVEPVPPPRADVPALTPPAEPPVPSPAPSPPPAIAGSMGASGPEADEIIATGSRRGGDRMLSSPAPIAKIESDSGRVRSSLPSRPGQPQGQAGLLTAGDHDDLLNPQLYARYATRYLQNHAQPSLPLLDAAQRIRIVVRDAMGHPAPFVQIAIARSNAAPLVLMTAADGAISVFPALDGLPTRLALTVTPLGGQPFARSVTPLDRVVAVDLPGTAAAVRKVDLLLTIDTTGSMGDELGYLQAELKSIIARLKNNNPGIDLRIGLLAYRDVGDEYVTRKFALTSDVGALQTSLAAQRADGGGDYPEAVEQALAQSVSDFDWRGDAVKAMLFVADAPPHDDKMAAAWGAAMAARARGIHIVPVGASGVAEDAQYLMRSMAAVTQSRYIFLTDDSGVGLPHEDPDVPCYLVTRLDGLVGRVLAGLIAGKRIEPQQDEVIRRVGDYDKGLCLPSRAPRPEPRPYPRPRPPHPEPRPY